MKTKLLSILLASTIGLSYADEIKYNSFVLQINGKLAEPKEKYTIGNVEKNNGGFD